MKKRKTICILGAGNAGLFSALTLKKTSPGLDIFVVGSSELGIVGVGESSTEHFGFLANQLGVPHKDIVKNCYATFKFGVYFDNWIGKDYVHSLITQVNDQGDNYSLYSNMACEVDPLELVPEQNINWRVDSDDNLPNQFHFDTFKLNEWLITQCAKNGIVIYDDLIESVDKSENGVELITGKHNSYKADLYVDASGFKRILANEFDEFEWVSRQSDLFVDSAFAFQCEHEGDNYPCYTTAKKMSSGWMWRIPTYTRMGNGYAYSSKHTTYEDAVKEVTEVLGFEPKVGRRFEFDAGHYNKTWHKNVVLIGLSSHFFEPLEATAIGVGIQQARLLSEYVYGTGASESYNETVQLMFQQVFDFVRLHYVNCEITSDFWKDVAEATIPESVQKYIDITQHRLISSQDVGGNPVYRIFGQENFNQVLYAIGLIPHNVLLNYINSRGLLPMRFKFDNKSQYKHKELIDMWVNE